MQEEKGRKVQQRGQKIRHLKKTKGEEKRGHGQSKTKRMIEDYGEGRENPERKK